MTENGTDRFEECVVCGADDHDGDGWIFHTSDAEVVGITPDGGLERELRDDARPICSIECKDEFEESDEHPLERPADGDSA